MRETRPDPIFLLFSLFSYISLEKARICEMRRVCLLMRKITSHTKVESEGEKEG